MPLATITINLFPSGEKAAIVSLPHAPRPAFGISIVVMRIESATVTDRFERELEPGTLVSWHKTVVAKFIRQKITIPKYMFDSFFVFICVPGEIVVA